MLLAGMICIWHCFECEMGLSLLMGLSLTHLARETMPYAFSRTIYDVLCTSKRFHNFIFHQSARWVYFGLGVKVGSLFWSVRNYYYLLYFLHPTVCLELGPWHSSPPPPPNISTMSMKPISVLPGISVTAPICHSTQWVFIRKNAQRRLQFCSSFHLKTNLSPKALLWKILVCWVNMCCQRGVGLIPGYDTDRLTCRNLSILHEECPLTHEECPLTWGVSPYMRNVPLHEECPPTWGMSPYTRSVLLHEECPPPPCSEGLTCRNLSILHEECSGPAPSIPWGNSITRLLWSNHFAEKQYSSIQ